MEQLIEETVCVEILVSDIHDVVVLDGTVHIIWQIDRIQGGQRVHVLAARMACTPSNWSKIRAKLLMATDHASPSIQGGDGGMVMRH